MLQAYLIRTNQQTNHAEEKSILMNSNLLNYTCMEQNRYLFIERTAIPSFVPKPTTTTECNTTRTPARTSPLYHLVGVFKKTTIIDGTVPTNYRFTNLCEKLSFSH